MSTLLRNLTLVAGMVVVAACAQGRDVSAVAQRFNDREAIGRIIQDRTERSRTADPKTLSDNPASLRRFNLNSDSLIEFVDAARDARHASSGMVVMHTNVNIHIFAVGRYADELEKARREVVDREARAQRVKSP
jgi:hypothetical protein